VNNEYRLKDDPFWRVQRCSSSSPCNGVTPAANDDNNSESWVVTTPDGVQYWFGYGVRVDGVSPTESVFYQPVYGNDPGEPCSTTPGWCQQAYRWNLDRIIDPNLNKTQIIYTREENYYQRASSGTASGVMEQYVRGGYPRRVEYGQNPATPTVAKPGVVVFNTTYRCTQEVGSAGPPCLDGDASWPDTPTDLDCTASPCAKSSPSYYTKLRLSSVVSWTVQNTGGLGTWRAVDKVILDHEFHQTTGAKKLYLVSVRRVGDPTNEPKPSVAGGGTYMRAARTSFRWNRQDIVPFVEVDCRRDIVPLFARSVMLTDRGVLRVRGRVAPRSGASPAGG
jgi:hypothetical protein